VLIHQQTGAGVARHINVRLQQWMLRNVIHVGVVKVARWPRHVQAPLHHRAPPIGVVIAYANVHEGPSVTAEA
jgi:hypothetical protein